MGATTTIEAGVSLSEAAKPGGFRGGPALLALLCLLAAGAGGAVGALAGSSADVPAREAQEARAVAARATAIQLGNSLQEKAARERAALLDRLGRAGVLEEADDLAEAERLNLNRALEGELAKLPADDGRRVLAALVREGRNNDLDPLLLAAVVRVETHFDPYAVSQVGARGLMQLMPATAIDLARQRGERLTAGQLFNPVKNIELGAAYLRYLIDRFGDVRSALVAYNAGPTLARGRRLSAGVRAYPRHVLAEYQRLAWQCEKPSAAPAVAAQ